MAEFEKIQHLVDELAGYKKIWQLIDELREAAPSERPDFIPRLHDALVEALGLLDQMALRVKRLRSERDGFRSEAEAVRATCRRFSETNAALVRELDEAGGAAKAPESDDGWGWLDPVLKDPDA